MKNIAGLFFLSLIVLSIGCKKSKTQSTDLQMSAAVGAAQWRSYSSTVSVIKDHGAGIVISADSSNSRVTLTIGNYHGAGTYNVADSANGAVYYDFRASQVYKGSSGEIVVTSNTETNNSQTNIKGTFKFLTSGPYITNGIFDVTLTLD